MEKCKILFLTPEIHFFSPVLIRRTIGALPVEDFEFHMILTPKISRSKKSSSSLRGIIRKSGFRYLLYMFLLKLKFDFSRFMEILAAKAFDRRRFLYPRDLCRHFKIGLRRFESVNTPQCVEYLRDQLKPDIIVSVFFNQILKQEVLASAKEAALNVHPSPLPEYRGMAPIMWMLAEGAKEGGVTIHHMNEKIDDGRIIRIRRFEIEQSDNYFSLYSKAADVGAEMLAGVLESRPVPEGESQAPSTMKYGPVSCEIFETILNRNAHFFDIK